MHASFSWLSTSGTKVSSCHQLGVSHAQALQVTHSSSSFIGGSWEGISTFSSPEILTGPWRKQVNSSPNSSGSSKLKFSMASASPLGSEPPRKGGTQSREHGSLLATPGGASSSVPGIYTCSSPCFGEWACASDQFQMRGQLSHSISSCKVATMARAFWWASLTSARLLSTEAYLLPLQGVLLLGGWTSVGLDSSVFCGVLPLSHPCQFSKGATTSAMSPGSPGGDPGSLQSLYTS